MEHPIQVSPPSERWFLCPMRRPIWIPRNLAWQRSFDLLEGASDDLLRAVPCRLQLWEIEVCCVLHLSLRFRLSDSTCLGHTTLHPSEGSGGSGGDGFHCNRIQEHDSETSSHGYRKSTIHRIQELAAFFMYRGPVSDAQGHTANWEKCLSFPIHKYWINYIYIYDYMTIKEAYYSTHAYQTRNILILKSNSASHQPIRTFPHCSMVRHFDPANQDIGRGLQHSRLMWNCS